MQRCGPFFLLAAESNEKRCISIKLLFHHAISESICPIPFSTSASRFTLRFHSADEVAHRADVVIIIFCTLFSEMFTYLPNK